MPSYLQSQIEQRRKICDLSIQALERKAGLKSSAVRNILNGTSKNPSVHTLRAIADALDCSILDLLGEGDLYPQKDGDSSPKKGYPKVKWNNDLFVEAATLVGSILQKQNYTPMSDEGIFLIKEIFYLY